MDDSSRVPNASGIYCITCVTTKKIYIGSALNLRKRRNLHFEELRRGVHCNPKLLNAWNKYGEEAFIFNVIELVLPAFLIEREQYWLDKLHPFGSNGFNINRNAASRLGAILSDESRAKIAARKKGISNPHPGHAITPETRAKLSAARMGNKNSLGRKLSAEHRAKIAFMSKKTFIVIDPNGTEYLVHGLKQFCEEHSLNHSCLIGVAKGRLTHYKGWKARYPETGVS